MVWAAAQQVRRLELAVQHPGDCCPIVKVIA